MLGFALLTAGIAVGMVWARSEWGVAWVWEAKSVWTLLSWAVYLGYLVARRTAGWQGQRAAWLATLGFVLTVATFLSSSAMLGAGLAGMDAGIDQAGRQHQPTRVDHFRIAGVGIVEQARADIGDAAILDQEAPLDVQAGGRIAQEFRQLPAERRRERVRDVLGRRKVFDFLLQHAQVSEEPASNPTNLVVPASGAATA